MAWKTAPFEFREVTGRRNQRIIAAEEDAPGADDFDGQGIDLGTIEKRGSRRIIKDPLRGPSDLWHELIEEEAAPPMGEDEGHMG
jgi:hypothetical protein